MTPNDKPPDPTVQAGLDFDVSNLRLELQNAGETLRKLALWPSKPAPSIPEPSRN
jgi:hypothetical protein